MAKSKQKSKTRREVEQYRTGKTREGTGGPGMGDTRATMAGAGQN